MDFPLANLYVVHWIRPYSKLCLNYKTKAVSNVNNHFFFRIENTIHFDALTSGNFDTYKELIEITLQADHSIDKFMKLKESWDQLICDPIVIDYYPKAQKWVIKDGVHRICLMKYFNIISDRIPFSMLKFNVSPANKTAIQNVLRATTKETLYNGWNNKRAPFGYHCFEFFGLDCKGQRNNIMRIQEMKKHVEFLGKSVLDLGCNSGGMLLHLPEIAKGRGFDYDATCVDAGNAINAALKLHKDLKFAVADLETVDLGLLKADGPFDIVFLCSLGSWIKNWKEVYTWAVGVAPLLIFEENNETEGRPQIEFFESVGCTLKKIIANSPDDTTGNRMRNTYLITTPK